LEKQCLSHAVQLMAEHRVIVHENKTIVFWFISPLTSFWFHQS
jgi:hypothetical protein